MAYLRSRYGRRGFGDTTTGTALDTTVPASQSVVPAAPIVDAQTAAWQQQVIANQQSQLSWLTQAENRQRTQKWVAIAVTACIPVFGAIWKAILGRRRARMSL